MAELHIRERRVGDVIVLALHGKITIGAASVYFINTVRRLLEEGWRKFVVNLSGVSYVDSSGLHALVWTFILVDRENGTLRHCHLTEKIRDLLAITKMLTVFDVYESVEDALAALGVESYAPCPVHGCQHRFDRVRLLRDDLITCPECGSEIRHATLKETDIPVRELEVKSVRVPTYAGEYVEVLTAEAPIIIEVVGRLDLFASEVLERAWRTVPAPRRGIFRLSSRTEASALGVKALLGLCGPTEEGGMAVVLCGARQTLPAELSSAPHVYRSKRSALRALNSAPAVPPKRLTMRLSY